MRPVFIGGSSRSGTHAMGRLIAADPDHWLIPVETRIHAAEGGLADLLTGAATMDHFIEKATGSWWRRGLRNHGLCELLERDAFDAMLAEFQGNWSSDPLTASQELMDGILAPVVAAHGKSSWIDVTGGNIRAAPALSRIFPSAQFVHMYRDGRAVAASILNRRDMSNDPSAALCWWARRIRHAHNAMKVMSPDRLMLVSLEDLAARNREETFERLVDFLEIEDAASMRASFERDIDADSAHVGAWRSRVSPEVANLLDTHHLQLLRGFEWEGIDWLPPTRDSGD